MDVRLRERRHSQTRTRQSRGEIGEAGRRSVVENSNSGTGILFRSPLKEENSFFSF